MEINVNFLIFDLRPFHGLRRGFGRRSCCSCSAVRAVLCGSLASVWEGKNDTILGHFFFLVVFSPTNRYYCASILGHSPRTSALPGWIRLNRCVFFSLGFESCELHRMHFDSFSHQKKQQTSADEWLPCGNPVI